MPPLEGKVAIVTGASSGIGAAVAKDLVEAGMKVAGLARRIDKVEELAKSLQGKKGKFLPIKCDVTSEEDIKRAFDEVEKELGPPTALINNAGVYKPVTLQKIETDHLSTMLNTNLFGLAICAREAVNLMMKHQIEGTIVNICSTAGHAVPPFPGLTCYAATKFGVRALSDGMRIDLKETEPNIRVTCLSPGIVESEMSDFIIRMKDLPSSHYLDSSNIADCVHFILEAPQKVNVQEMMVAPSTNIF